MSTPTKNTVGVSSVSYSGNNAIDALLWGTKWNDGGAASVSLTYSFPTNTAWYSSTYDMEGDGNEWNYAYSLSSSHRADVRGALQAWSKVAGVRFTEVADNASVVGDIRFAASDLVDYEGAGGWAFLPNSHPRGGDIWLSPDALNGRSSAPQTYNYLTYIHEIGHALGLDHSFSGISLPKTYDHFGYTVMSYTAGPNGSNNWADRYPTTPMIYDILAIQHLYGKNTSYNSGNTTYTFSSTGRYWQTIWDGGGNDTIAVTGSGACVLDLRSGAFCEIGAAIQFTHTQSYKTVGIAYGANIENATGGSGNDRLIGNGFNNILNGGAGRDTMSGATGNDTYYVDNASDQVIESAGAGTDTIRASLSCTLGSNVENLILTGSGSFNGIGNSLNNQITGNSGSNILNGGSGADRMIGGGGNDLYYVDNAGDVVIESASAGTDTVRAYLSCTLGSNFENLILAGSGSINGTGNSLNNLITGNSGNNTLNGGTGNDVLIGAAGRDRLVGGSGADRFDFNSALESVVGSNRDAILDFSGIAGDRIDLSTIDANTLLAGNQAFIWRGSAAFSGAGQVRFSGGVLQISTDSDSAAEMEIHLGSVSMASGYLIL